MPQTTSRSIALAAIAAEEIDQLGEFLRLVLDVAASDRGGDAMRGMVFQDLVLDALERRLDRLHLDQNVDAIAIFRNHAGDAAYLALDPRQPGQQFVSVLLRHLAYPYGV